MHHTIEAIEKHVAAIRSPLYELGVFFPRMENGGDARMLLRTWDEQTLMRSVPWLRAKNAEGAAIYIRPSGEHPDSLIDDLTGSAAERMKTEGFTPAIVVETSPGNFQAWLNHGETLDKRTSTAAARALAERFQGDPGAADWRHFGRLSGFTNRKPQYLQPNGFFPFVRIIEHNPGLVYSRAGSLVNEVRRELLNERVQSTRSPAIRHWANRRFKTIDEFRADPAYNGDGNRIDLAFAVYALGHGVSEHDVRAAIQTRDLSKKGSQVRQLAYVSRTIAKARQRFLGDHGR